MANKFVCIHGHFYQPPRENPWTGRIDRQRSAAPDHDWNCRIARECYVPNGKARVEGGGRRTLAVVNNYAHLSFNFGPTLLSWLERERPETYRKLLEADQDSARRLGGHGNAIAQAYNHMILPLANARDRRTQVLWGIADFEYRFRRKPEALWLPETACNDAVLRLLADCGMKYVILAPGQAQRARPLASSAWRSVADGRIDVRRPYLWRDRRSPSRRIAVFFYDGPLSHGVSFGRLMSSSKACADRIAEAFDHHGRAEPLVTICTDGETYGHHEKFADLGLAHLFQFELPARQIAAVNFGFYLSRQQPEWEVELKAGPQGLGTAWSCAHGLGRWLEDCGCGREGGSSQRWRGPLRQALDWLRDGLAVLCAEEGSRLLRDLWEARDDYIRLVLDPREHEAELFFARHLRASHSPAACAAALRLMEIQRHAMLMYTSCGWFFSELSGIEAVQNLKYAARAIELAREQSGRNLEPEFLARLRLAPSNDPGLADGAGVYRRLVRRPR